MAIDQTASTVALARSLLSSLDRAALNTTLATPTVELLLTTLIDLGTRDNPTARAVQSAQVGFVNSRVAGVGG